MKLGQISRDLALHLYIFLEDRLNESQSFYSKNTSPNPSCPKRVIQDGLSNLLVIASVIITPRLYLEVGRQAII